MANRTVFLVFDPLRGQYTECQSAADALSVMRDRDARTAVMVNPSGKQFMLRFPEVERVARSESDPAGSGSA